MSRFWNMSYLGVCLDMAGCPNRCRHCWLGSHRNSHISSDAFCTIASQFRNWRDEKGKGICEFGFFSWWREPDYREDYRKLWQLEQELSSPGKAMRFELLSIWRLAREESYANWAATLPPKACQISFFGMEENTDWVFRRKGAFRDNLTATERLLSAGISPRWQLFVTKRCIHETEEFLRLIKDIRLHERCAEIGGKFEVFIGTVAPEGNGFKVEDIRLEENDLPLISQELVSICRDGLNIGQPEYQLMESLLSDCNPINLKASMPAMFITADYDVYPNIAEPAPWWRLGNLESDGVDVVIKAYRDQAIPGMITNRNMPIKELSHRYGDPMSTRIYSKSDLLVRWMHQWGVDYIKEGKQ